MTQATKTQKQVQVIARYQIKRNGHVVYTVRSSNGHDTYTTTLVNGKATGCSCPATKPCYHMTQLEAREVERTASRQEQAAPVQAEDENEVVSVKVGNVTVCSSRKHISNAVEHTKWSQEMVSLARAKDAERVAAVEGAKVEARYFEQKRALDEQYSQAPSAWELSETEASYMRCSFESW